MIVIYVDYLNLVGTFHEIALAATYLMKEFEMKDQGKTRFCLGIQIKYLSNGIFIHQSSYTEKVLKRFNMDKVYPLSNPMVIRTLDVQKNPFYLPGEGEIILGPVALYLRAVGASIYLANNIRLDIAIAMNLLARYSSTPT